MKAKHYLLFALVVVLAYWIGFHRGIGNQYPTYGETGFPKNCRALIADNIRGFDYKQYTAEEALYSIDRNCGANGLIWGER